MTTETHVHQGYQLLSQPEESRRWLLIKDGVVLRERLALKGECPWCQAVTILKENPDADTAAMAFARKEKHDNQQ